MDPGEPSSRRRSSSIDFERACLELPHAFHPKDPGSSGDAAELVVPDATNTMLKYNIIEFTLLELEEYTDEFANNIGNGGHSNVYRGLIRGRPERDLNGLEIAVKASHKVSGSARVQWNAEMENIPLFQHKNIIKLIGFCDTPTRLYLIFPYMEKGTVRDNLEGLTWKQTIKIIKGVTSAIRELHCKTWLVYIDLKPSNILLDKDYTPKLSDFGLVRQGVAKQEGTFGNTAPEIIQAEPGYRSSDIWSLGILILQLIMKSPQTSKPDTSIIREWAEKEYWENNHAVHDMLRSDCSGKKARTITRLGIECTKGNAAERPTIDRALEVILKVKESKLKELVRKLN